MHQKAFFIFSFLSVFSGSVCARTDVTADYRYYSSDTSFQRGTLRAKSTFDENHTLFTHYGQVRDMDPNFHILHSAGLGYFYLSDTVLAGGGIKSASDAPFASLDVTDFFAFGGYTLYSRELGTTDHLLPDGSTHTHTRKTKFVLGLMGTTKPIYRMYVLPVIGFIYEGEMLRFSIGLPETRISFTPNDRHEFSLTYEDNDNELRYSFKPVLATKLSVMYATEQESYYIQSEVEGRDRMNRRAHFYYREWVKLRIDQHLSKGIKAYAEYGYQLDGRYRYARTFNRRRSTKLDDTQMYRIGISIGF